MGLTIHPWLIVVDSLKLHEEPSIGQFKQLAVRSGVLEIGRDLLQGWSRAADSRVAAPQCTKCEEAMRHKGYVCGPLVTTLGNLRVARVRFRCEYCDAESYPQDARCAFAVML